MAHKAHSLAGKTALITGSTSGIGLGIAKKLAAQGCNIMLNGFGDYESVLEAITAMDVQVDYHGADMGQPSDIENLMNATANRFGRCDILVNNAGIQHVAPVETFPTERWNAVIAINLSSAFHTSRLALPAMQAANWGRIINIASVHGLTKVTALENATSGVTCNAICPGWVLTPLVQQQVDARAKQMGVSNEESKRSLLAEKEPSLQFTTPEELGDLAVFLCGPASNNIRGVAWQMDGGWSAQ